MDRFSELRAFVDVVEAGSFSGAARETGQSRSSVNRLVIALEERLGVQLLHRTTRSVSTNSNGRALYERAKQILNDLEEVELSVTASQRVPVGKLRISAPHSFGDLDFSEIVTGFLKQHPQVEIEISFENRLIDPVTEGYDLVIRVAEPDEETVLVDHRIMTLDYLLCASPSYLREYGTPQTAECLKDHHGLSLLQSEQSGFWVLSGPDGPAKVKVRPVLRANTMDALLKAASEGLGIAVLPEYAIRSELEAGRLRQLLSDYQFPSRMLQVIYPPARHLSANVQAFTDFVSDWCKR
ncbi:LysR family transcriptional regulator [Ruegeria sp. R14_0]|uniref:LysR family transcriptional regulator n=1 Tax=Ruegeria sp. R14_0 TaxID=2821100 RepID=UPI001ADAE775|nr:LysR family transcriptional regulator [Ruegeria sp. R14_0]MBO9447575.1 LysR family transcriptional regulator [Ruegeria sp. R14_0]